MRSNETSLSIREVPAEAVTPEVRREFEVINIAAAGSFMGRLREISNDEEAKAALAACARIPVNAALAALDAFPIIGEAVSMSNLGMKGLRVIAPFLKKVDPTPDVGLVSTGLMEAGLAPVELATGGMFPSFLVNGLRQAQIDFKRGHFDNAGKVLGYLFTGNERYRQELQDKGLLLNSAANVFLLGKESHD